MKDVPHPQKIYRYSDAIGRSCHCVFLKFVRYFAVCTNHARMSVQTIARDPSRLWKHVRRARLMIASRRIASRRVALMETRLKTKTLCNTKNSTWGQGVSRDR